MFATLFNQLAQPAYIIPCALLLGLALRLFDAASFYLNPDEAIHFCRSQPATWYAESNLRGTAPPFFFFVVHYTQQIANSEFFVRLPFLLSGCLFPWVIYKWLERLNLPTAALTSFLILEFSPNLIALTTQIRGYAIALLLTSLAIYFLERALQLRAIPSLLLSATFLYLGILTEFSVAFATAAMGVYALLRILQNSEPLFSRFHLVWAATQIGALAVYFFLYKTMMADLLSRPIVGNTIEGYLRGAFPKPGENLLRFFASSTAKQLAYLASSIPMGFVFLALFLAGLVSIWISKPRTSRSPQRILSLAALTAFSIAFAACLTKTFPYGRTRHSIVLALFATPVIAIGLERILQSIPRLVLPISLLITAMLFPLSEQDPQNIHRSRHDLTAMLEAVQQLRSSIPPGSFIFADYETLWIMNFYINNRQCSPITYGPEPLRRLEALPFRFASLRWSHQSPEQTTSDLLTLRKVMQLPPTQPIHILDSGFDLLPQSTPSAQTFSSVLLWIPPRP
jgi:hypothetical protein